jgi:hypothetical protein
MKTAERRINSLNEGRKQKINKERKKERRNGGKIRVNKQGTKFPKLYM